MPRVFAESIGNEPLGEKSYYLRSEKNQNLLEIYQNVKIILEKDPLFSEKNCFLSENLSFLLKKNE